MKKLTQKQIDMLWGESGPYSQANLKKEVRILDDSISRIFLIVETDINPTTFEIVRKNRNNDLFKTDQAIQQLLDYSEHRGPHFGYISMAFEREYIDESAMYAAETALRYTEKTIIKMHKFIIDNYKIEFAKNIKIHIDNKTKKQIFERRREIENEVIDMLEETNSDFVLDDVKDIVYNEKDNNDMQKLIAVFDDGNEKNLGNVIEITTDAWNYFPHKSLNGKCPEEMMLEYRKKDKGK